jgi:predicted phage terminase large subunit-like protein
MTPQEIATFNKMRRMDAADHLASFMEYVREDEQGDPLIVQPFQASLIAVLENPECKRVVIQAAPGSGKTIALLSFAAWSLGKNPNERILLMCNTNDQAEERASAIQEMMINKPATPWTRGTWSIERTGGGESPFPSMFSAGMMNPKVQGFRPTLILCDDIQSQQEARSSLVAEQHASWIRQTLYPRLIPGGRHVCIGTRWSQMDALSVFREDGFKVVHVQALNDKDESYWPDRFPADYLIKIRNRDAGEFACVYQGDPSQRGSAMIQRDWIQFVDYKDLPEFVGTGAFCDLAMTDKKTSCNTAMVYGGVDVEANLYVVDVRAGKWLWTDGKRELLSFIRRHNVKKLGMQNTTLELENRFQFRELPELLDMSFPATKTYGGKSEHFAAVADRAANRKLFIVKDKWNEYFLDEICNFPNSRLKDQADAMSGLVEILANKAVNLPGEAFVPIGTF